MRASERSLLDLQGPIQKFERLVVLAAIPHQDAKVDQRVGDVRMRGSERLLFEGQGSLIIRKRFAVLPLSPKHHADVVERSPQLMIVMQLFSDLERTP